MTWYLPDIGVSQSEPYVNVVYMKLPFVCHNDDLVAINPVTWLDNIHDIVVIIFSDYCKQKYLEGENIGKFGEFVAFAKFLPSKCLNFTIQIACKSKFANILPSKS